MGTVLVPITVEQDEDGAWCAHADLGPLGGANGEGDSREEAIADVRQAIALVFEDRWRLGCLEQCDELRDR